MPGVVVLNPATVDGYGNPISVTRDGYVNRLLTSAKVTGQPHVELFDADGNPVKIITHPGFNQLAVNDQEQIDLLGCIYSELKKIRMHISLLTEENIENNDVEDDD